MEQDRNIAEDLAITLAATHPGLNAEELRSWFERLFANTPDVIETWNAFREAYSDIDDVASGAITPPPVWIDEMAREEFTRIGTITMGFISGGSKLDLLDLDFELY